MDALGEPARGSHVACLRVCPCIASWGSCCHASIGDGLVEMQEDSDMEVVGDIQVIESSEEAPLRAKRAPLGGRCAWLLWLCDV